MSVKVGDEVYIVQPRRHGRSTKPDGEMHKVTRVGRKYFYVQLYRLGSDVGFDLTTMHEQGESNYRAKAYHSKADYDEKMDTERKVAFIRGEVSGWGWHKGLTKEQINTIYTTLKEANN